MAAEPSSGGGDAFAKAHRELLADRSLQFDLPMADVRPPSTPPAWLKGLLEALGAAMPVVGWLFWAGVVLLVGLIAFVVIREFAGARFGGFGRKAAGAQAGAAKPAEWRPTEAAARVLLGDADRLAAEGRYAEAAHLLLLRSIDDIQKHRPRAVRPALTARDIASLEALPPSARPSFREIAVVVERSLFGGGSVDAETYAACRNAYEAFALPGGWRS